MIAEFRRRVEDNQESSRGVDATSLDPPMTCESYPLFAATALPLRGVIRGISAGLCGDVWTAPRQGNREERRQIAVVAPTGPVPVGVRDINGIVRVA